MRCKIFMPGAGGAIYSTYGKRSLKRHSRWPAAAAMLSFPILEGWLHVAEVAASLVRKKENHVRAHYRRAANHHKIRALRGEVPSSCL